MPPYLHTRLTAEIAEGAEKNGSAWRRAYSLTALGKRPASPSILAANCSVLASGSLVSRRSLFTSPTISITPQPRHIIAFVMTSPVSSVRNFVSCGRNEVRTAEIIAPAAKESPPHREQVAMGPSL